MLPGRGDPLDQGDDGLVPDVGRDGGDQVLGTLAIEAGAAARDRSGRMSSRLVLAPVNQ
jgi:hypothetical protein